MEKIFQLKDLCKHYFGENFTETQYQLTSSRLKHPILRGVVEVVEKPDGLRRKKGVYRLLVDEVPIVQIKKRRDR